MIVILSVAKSEVRRAYDYLSWVNDLGGCKAHQLVILVAFPVAKEDCIALRQIAANSFRSVEVIRQHERCELPWPKNANAMFKCAADYMRSQLVAKPWAWLELDAIPIKSGWIDAIEREYYAAGKPFMGAEYSMPQRHINGVAVYPSTLSTINPWMVNATHRPFDLTHPEIALRLGHATNLIVRSLADPRTNTPHTFPDVASLEIIPKTCVLFHGCKDGTILARLREKLEVSKGPTVVPERNPSSLTRIGRKLLKKGIFNLKRKLKLPTITVWAASWSTDKVMLDRTIRVLRYCNRLIEPARTVLFSYMPAPTVRAKPDSFGVIAEPFDVIPIPQLDWQKWNIFVNREVPKHITTGHALSIHEDGFILDVSCWDNDFLEYDLVGAPWQDLVVGNGGVCLESRKLLQAKLKMPTDPNESNIAADMFVCRNRRKFFEDQGIRFAPCDLALKFSTETRGNNWPSFAFHGRQWSPEKYAQGWRLIEESEK